jgi:hypothetical protein
MRMTRLLLFSIVFLPSIASAGQIYGNLKEGDRPVRQGVTVQVTCRNPTPYQGQTDAYGSYSINVRESTNCELKVLYDGCTPTIQIYSEDEPIRYDFVIQKEPACVLQRR